MSGRLHIVSVNQDPGISPHRQKGAAIHLNAMRNAFHKLGAEVSAIDDSEEAAVSAALERLHRQSPLSLIYERYALGRSCAARFARANRIPFALEVNAPLADEQRRWRGKSERASDVHADQLTFSQASLVCAVSSQVAGYAVQRGARSGAVEVCPNGIDTTLFNLGVRGDPGPARGEDGWPFVLGFQGRERPWHRFDRLVELVEALLRENLPVHLKVVGAGEFEPLKALPPATYSRVDWVAHEALPEHLASFDAMPLAYSPDAPCYFSPLKLMEAMACGVVPVVPDLGDLSTVVSNGHSGLVYPAGDSEAMVDAVKGLVLDRERCRRLGRRAARSARNCDWTRIARLVIDRTVDDALSTPLERAVG